LLVTHVQGSFRSPRQLRQLRRVSVPGVGTAAPIVTTIFVQSAMYLFTMLSIAAQDVAGSIVQSVTTNALQQRKWEITKEWLSDFYLVVKMEISLLRGGLSIDVNGMR